MSVVSCPSFALLGLFSLSSDQHTADSEGVNCVLQDEERNIIDVAFLAKTLSVCRIILCWSTPAIGSEELRQWMQEID